MEQLVSSYLIDGETFGVDGPVQRKISERSGLSLPIHHR